jgi:hypothetical protein
MLGTQNCCSGPLKMAVLSIHVFYVAFMWNLLYMFRGTRHASETNARIFRFCSYCLLLAGFRILNNEKRLYINNEMVRLTQIK